MWRRENRERAHASATEGPIFWFFGGLAKEDSDDEAFALEVVFGDFESDGPLFGLGNMRCAALGEYALGVVHPVDDRGNVLLQLGGGLVPVLDFGIGVAECACLPR